MSDTQLSPHFTLAELTRSTKASQMHIDNTPGPVETANLTRLALTVLEPMRELLDVVIHINSGYRCEAINAAVGSTAKHSAHLDGRAADTVPAGLDLKEAFDKVRASEIPFDQIIIENNAWLHVAVAAEGVEPRRQALVASGGPGNWHYAPAPALD